MAHFLGPNAAWVDDGRTLGGDQIVQEVGRRWGKKLAVDGRDVAGQHLGRCCQLLVKRCL
jgi:hypothetical protein